MAPPNPFEYYRSIANPELPSGDSYQWTDQVKQALAKYMGLGFESKDNYANEKGFLYGGFESIKRIQYKFLFKRFPLVDTEESKELAASDSPVLIGELQGVAHFGDAAMGPPGFVHGGAIATLADQAMGEAVWYAFTPSVTANLNVNYRNPIPLDSDAWVSVKVPVADRRKTNVTFTLCSLDGKTLYAEGSALFIQPRGWEMPEALKKE